MALFYKKSLSVKQHNVVSETSFECMVVINTTGNEVVRFAIVYRPPSGGKSGQPASVFLDEFYQYLDSHATTSGKLLVVGDFNFHTGDSNDQGSKKFSDVLHSLNLKQHLNEPTHSCVHKLDLVITSYSELAISNLQVDAPVINDHGTVSFTFPLGKPSVMQETRKVCNLKDIDIEEFQKDMLTSSLYTSPANDVNDFMNQYSIVLEDILDVHALQQMKKIIPHPHAPWFNDEIRHAKQARRRAEKQ